MKYKYTAYFSPDDEEQSCLVEIPALDISFTVNPLKWSQKDMIEAAREELAMTLCLWEMSSIERPEDTQENIPMGCEFGAVIEADTETAAKRIVSIERIDIDDDE